ncbi:MAG: tRNA pseudouridine(13) synthase TruD, partial [archaeon]|nr:tRNA pseudouridine(13) synthase TruD [archaeon]
MSGSFITADNPSLSARVFPNYFGIQRFGAVRPITHLVGK